MTDAPCLSLDPLSAGVFVDADNLSSAHAPALLRRAGCRPRVARIYGGVAALKGWAEHAAFEPVLSAAATPSRNATDMTLAVDALHLAMTERLSVVILASSDGDFTPLARMLRRLGVQVLGMGEAKTSRIFRRSCTAFDCLSPLSATSETPAPTEEAQVVLAVRRALGADWKMVGSLAKEVKETHGYDRNTPGIGQWSKWLQSRPDLFEFHDLGSQSRVRVRPQCASAPFPKAPIAFSTTGSSA